LELRREPLEQDGVPRLDDRGSLDVGVLPVARADGIEHGHGACVRVLEVRVRCIERVRRIRDPHRLEVRQIGGPELAVPGREVLVLAHAVDVELLTDDGSLHHAVRALELNVGLGDGHLLPYVGTYVLGVERVADLRIRRHDHRCGSIHTGEPRSFVRVRHAVLEVRHVLAEVPDGAVVGLRVPIEGHLLDPSAEPRGVLGHARRDDVAAPDVDVFRLREERGLRVERKAVDVAEEHRGLELRDREQRVVDRRRVREHRRLEVDAIRDRCFVERLSVFADARLGIGLRWAMQKVASGSDDEPGNESHGTSALGSESSKARAMQNRVSATRISRRERKNALAAPKETQHRSDPRAHQIAGARCSKSSSNSSKRCSISGRRPRAGSRESRATG
jgi:hypothetical protein